MKPTLKQVTVLVASLLMLIGSPVAQQTISTTVNCSGSPVPWYDSGGSGSNYSNSEYITQTFCPDAPGQYVTIDFSSFDIENPDYISIIDGDGSHGFQSFVWSSTMDAPIPTTITSSTDGCLTTTFVSNSSITNSGWDASISCTTTPGNNSNLEICSTADCQGGCGEQICGSGEYSWIGNGNSVPELTDGPLYYNNNGCLQEGEVCSAWFYINVESAGDFSMNIVPSGGGVKDQDFAIWEGFGGFLQCPGMTHEQPVRCNYAKMNNEGTGTGFDDSILDEWHENSIWILQSDVANGIYFVLLVNTYSNGGSCSNPTVDITFGGSAKLKCDLLAATFGRFEGVARDDYNDIYWETISEQNCESFTLERSKDLTSWEQVGVLPGAGNSDRPLHYTMKDYNRLNPITYYRIKERDFDGKLTYSEVISVSKHPDKTSWIVDIFPNPANENFTFQYNGTNREDALEVAVYDLLGRQVIRQEFMLKLHEANVINTQQLENGQYQVVFTQGRQKQTQNLTILKN